MAVLTLPQLEAPSLVAGLATAEQAMAGLTDMPLSALQDAELGDAVAALTQLESRAGSLRLAVLAEADRRRVAERSADTGTDAWAARLTGESRQVMLGGILLAQDLRDRFHHTREAFASGALTLAQVRVIVHACRQAPPAATADQLAAAEEIIVNKATGAATRSGCPMNPKRLRQAVRRMFATIDQDLADQHEANLLGREQRRAEARTFFELHDNGDGTFSGRFCIPELHGHLFKQAIERLTAPRRLGRDRQGQVLTDTTVTTSNKYENDGSALCELLEHLPTDGWTAKNGVTLLVTMELDKLLRRLTHTATHTATQAGTPSGTRADTGSARLDTGTHISAGEARRLACNANLVPVVLGTSSRVLDLGFSSRLHTEGQRLAYAVMHDTCAVDGCERPFAWCEIHHPHAWSQGGRTDLDNGLPLCGHHHRRAHDEHVDLRRHDTGEWRFHARR